MRRGAFQIQPITARHKLLATPVLGLIIGGLAVFFAEETGKSSHFVLFSGQSGLSPLIDHAATWSLGALVLLIVCKGLAYSASLGGFKGGPVFPGMFLGAAVGIAFSHFPGLSLVDSVAMGIGAMLSVVIGGLPLSSVLLTLVFIQSDAFEVISVVILAVAVSFVASAWLERWLKPASHALVPAPVGPAGPNAEVGAASGSRSGLPQVKAAHWVSGRTQGGSRPSIGVRRGCPGAEGLGRCRPARMSTTSNSLRQPPHRMPSPSWVYSELQATARPGLTGLPLSLSASKVHDDLDVVWPTLQGVGDVLGQHSTSDQPGQPGAVGGGEGLGGTVEVSAVGVDRADDHIVLQHYLFGNVGRRKPARRTSAAHSREQTTPPAPTWRIESMITEPTPVHSITTSGARPKAAMAPVW